MPTFRWMTLMIAVSLTVACGGGASEPEPVAATAEPETTGDEDAPIPTAEFIGMVTVQATPEVCGDASLLRTCYPAMDASLCAQAFGAAMMACGEAMSETLPATVDGSTADSVAGAVANCARVAYQDGLAQAGVERTVDCPLEH